MPNQTNEPAAEGGDALRFAFGQNWQDFVTHSFDRERVEISKRHILEFLEKEDLHGVDMIDIGCGSGLHSVAALDAGAKRIDSFDLDPESVAAAKSVHKQLGDPDNWSIARGSVLDENYIQSLPRYDLVYAWGVLHHTGAVWQALENAASLAKPGALFYVALYSADAHKDPPPEFWLAVKQRYVSSSRWMKRLIEAWYIRRFHIGRNIFNLPAFVRTVRDYKKNRGMSFMTDQRDWLGGWPMEFVGDQEAIEFVEKLGFALRKRTSGKANSEFLFVRVD